MEIKLPKTAHEGYKFMVIFAVVTIVLFFFSKPIGIIGVVCTIWCIAFFRDPDRVTPQKSSLVIAPADGRIIKIEKTIPPVELGLNGEMLKISIFMNVFNVHVNRSPCAGEIEKIVYHSGKFFNASLDKASVDNERQGFVMETEHGPKIAFVQIAGLIARRIVGFVNETSKVKAGEKFGLIKFGSRVDLYLPSEVIPLVEVGQTTIAGETIMADFDYSGEALNYEILDRAS